jgi:hypothetical protein
MRVTEFLSGVLKWMDELCGLEDTDEVLKGVRG